MTEKTQEPERVPWADMSPTQWANAVLWAKGTHWKRCNDETVIAHAEAMCKRYRLLPDLGHLVIDSRRTNEGTKERPVWVDRTTLYITRDGLLHIANSSGHKWSIDWNDPEERTNPYTKQEDVWLRGVLHKEGFPDFTGGLWFSEYDTGKSTWKSNPHTMHQKCVTVYLVRHGFNVALPTVEENERHILGDPAAPDPATRTLPEEPRYEPEPDPDHADQIAKLYVQCCNAAKPIGGEAAVQALLEKKGINDIYAATSMDLVNLIADIRDLNRRNGRPAANGARPSTAGIL